jgi:hypothetical protein
MKLASPYPAELLRVARKVVWYDTPQRTLDDIPTFLAHLMVYGSPADVAVVEGYLPAEEFRRALMHAPAGVFTQDAWTRWHKRLGLEPILWAIVPFGGSDLSAGIPNTAATDILYDGWAGLKRGCRTILELALQFFFDCRNE